jgi:hypothetical protein
MIVAESSTNAKRSASNPPAPRPSPTSNVKNATPENVVEISVDKQSLPDTLTSTKAVNSSNDQATINTDVESAASLLVKATTTLPAGNPLPVHKSSKKGSNKLKSTKTESTSITITGVENPASSSMSRNRNKNAFSSNTSNKLSTHSTNKFKDKYESSDDLLSESSDDNSDTSWKEGDQDSDAFKKPAARKRLRRGSK